jgi:hypothetical protein
MNIARIKVTDGLGNSSFIYTKRRTSPMPEPLDPIADARTPARQAARAAIVAPFAAMLVNLLAGQLMEDNAPITNPVNLIAGTVSSLLLLAGVAMGVAGIVGGLRRRSHDTTMIAGLGLFLSGGAVLLTIWVVAFLRARS